MLLGRKVRKASLEIRNPINIIHTYILNLNAILFIYDAYLWQCMLSCFARIFSTVREMAFAFVTI